MRAGIAGAAALALMLVSGAVSARDIPAAGFTMNDVVAWLQGRGYKAEIVTAADGRQHVSSESKGVKFRVYLFDCKGVACASMKFSAGFATHGKFDTSQMNAWNRDSRWARGYFDNVNDPWVEYDVDLTPGGSYELLDDEFDTWNATLERFIKQYNLQ
jgi:Putative bacterial sensory transduction regulator